MRTHTTGAGAKHPENKEKKHNTAATSRESFTAYTASGKRQTEAAKALVIIDAWQPITSRKLAELMQVERCHITRCLFDLQQAGKVRVSHVAKCQVTGKRVQHYCLASWQPELFKQ
ncbi:MAG TPA: hypothetical protein PLL71_10740 [Agriterribacter sp.]|nr:hypothetical protein [Agriterribacter sp.]HRP33931.1 hypothetical protein [Agriterribacter sp.]HRQ49329.1 hypothetical protein [Agriterribacter sp.]